MDTKTTLTSKLSEVNNRINIIESSRFEISSIYCSKCFRHAVVGQGAGNGFSSCCGAEIETGKTMMRRAAEKLNELDDLRERLEGLLDRSDAEGDLQTFKAEVEALCVRKPAPRREVTPVVATAFKEIETVSTPKAIISQPITPDIDEIDVMGNRSLPSGTYQVLSGPYPTRTSAKKLLTKDDAQAVTKLAKKTYYIIQITRGEK